VSNLFRGARVAGSADDDAVVFDDGIRQNLRKLRTGVPDLVGRASGE
jgi:hypothetical protein